MTKFLQLTDLHFGFNKRAFQINTEFFAWCAANLVFDAVLVTGDLACNQQKQLYTALRELRKAFSDKEIYVIFGNHDYWVHHKDYRHKFNFRWHDVLGKQNQHLHEQNIYHLQRTGPIKHNDVWLAGYDGWYKRLDPPTNDAGMIPDYIEGNINHKHFNKLAHQSLEKIIRSDIDFYNEKSLCLTHHSFIGIGGGHPDFSQDYRNIEALYSRGFDVVCYGHSHRRHFSTIPAKGNSDKDLRIYCAGGGYQKNTQLSYENTPEYWIIEI